MFTLPKYLTRMLQACGIVAALSLLAPGAQAQDYPSKPLRWIVGFPAGGGSDSTVRLLAKQLSERLGQPVVVENRPGAGAAIAAEVTAKSRPDGYTLFSADNGTLIFNPLLRKKLPYDVARDFAPVALYAKLPILLVVNPQTVPVDSVQSLIALSKTKPISYASSGLGSPHHLAGELFKDRTDAPLVHVPYGSASLMQDLAGGHIGVSFIGIANGMQLVKAGKVRALGVLEAQRLKSMPDIPTLAEAGVKDVLANAWQGVVVASGTPAPIIQRLHAELDAILKSPDTAARMREMGIEPLHGNPAEMQALISADLQRWGEVVRKSGITLDN